MSRFNNMTDREKRVVRYAGIFIAIYLALFAGYKFWGFFEARRAAYRALAQEAQELKQRTQAYEDKVRVVKKLMDDLHLDPARLKRESVVSGASAAIQKAAQSGGVQLGPIRETSARGTGKTLATMQLETSGQVSAVLGFLAGLNTIGYPLVVDSVQFTSDFRPGMIKMNLTVIILDFDEQKEAKEAAHA
jgi:hypothetical protein